MTRLTVALLGAASLLAAAPALAQTQLTIATVNNGDMIRMQKLTDDFAKMNPDITLNWVTLEENVLRQQVTTDIATKGGQFDILTIGTYEVPIWAKQGWLVPLDNLGRRLRRQRSAAADPRRSELRRQALCRCRSTARARSRCTARTCSRRPG